ncbi:hypothetical protein HPB47_004692 [Ixodes persulcatus]|uniref:Uncharacterized protein n=1 Tax=Ixodes persulcatus TaxID=34615 RepID=A0AC60PGF9_IXOPE|nr:hypothetical protein HPB47_004692 [Ixodes persulcatus]
MESHLPPQHQARRGHQHLPQHQLAHTKQLSKRNNSRLCVNIGHNVMLAHKKWSDLSKNTVDSVFTKEAATSIWGTDVLKRKSPTAALSNKARSLGKAEAFPPPTPEKVQVLRNLSTHIQSAIRKDWFSSCDQENALKVAEEMKERDPAANHFFGPYRVRDTPSSEDLQSTSEQVAKMLCLWMMSVHFTDESYELSSRLSKEFGLGQRAPRLKPDTVPTIFDYVVAPPAPLRGAFAKRRRKDVFFRIQVILSTFQTTQRMKKESEAAADKYIVFGSCLKKLLKRCSDCFSMNTQVSFDLVGSMVKATTTCSAGHTSIWESQPKCHGKPEGNILISLNTYTSKSTKCIDCTSLHEQHFLLNCQLLLLRGQQTLLRGQQFSLDSQLVLPNGQQILCRIGSRPGPSSPGWHGTWLMLHC